MKVIVKQGYTAFYGRMMRYAGDIVDIKEEECPKWANIYEEEIPSSEKVSSDNMVAPAHTVQKDINVTEQTEPSTIVQNEEEAPSTDNIQASEPANNELFEKLSQLIDEAVNLGIVYEPEENTSVQTQIDELLELINKKKV